MTDDVELVREAVEYCRKDAVYHPAIAALSRLTARLDAERWHPIETAPTNGVAFDGWQDGERVTDVYWSTVQDAWCVDGTYGPEEPTPLAVYPPLTHWRPLPTPPGAEG